jgi:CPA2 family monovalent cation:H+ antiporter-2
MKLRQLVVDGASAFLGKTLNESGINSLYKCLVVGIEEGTEELQVPSVDRVFKEGDVIWIVGERKALKKLVCND